MSLKGGSYIFVVETAEHKDIIEEMILDSKWDKRIDVVNRYDPNKSKYVYMVYAGSGKVRDEFRGEFFIKRDVKWSK